MGAAFMIGEPRHSSSSAERELWNISFGQLKLDVCRPESVLGTAIFLAASFTLGRRLVFSIIRWTNDSFVSEVPVVTAILVIMGTMALTTHLIGVHTVLGAFVAGILVGESPILTRHIDEQLRGLVVALFMPIFFSLAGLHVDLTHLGDSTLFFLTVGFILIASFGKFAGAFVGGAIGGLSARESLALGCGMNARGSTEVIVASIGLSSIQETSGFAAGFAGRQDAQRRSYLV
jgi:Kef-type K+ transport system membrane component KefB